MNRTSLYYISKKSLVPMCPLFIQRLHCNFTAIILHIVYIIRLPACHGSGMLRFCRNSGRQYNISVTQYLKHSCSQTNIFKTTLMKTVKIIHLECWFKSLLLTRNREKEAKREGEEGGGGEGERRGRRRGGRERRERGSSL